MYDHVEIWLKIYADTNGKQQRPCSDCSVGGLIWVLHCLLDQSDLGLHCLPKTDCPIR